MSDVMRPAESLGQPGAMVTKGDPIRFRSTVHPADETAVMELVRRTGFFHEPEVAIAGELVRETWEKGSAAGYHFLFADHVDLQSDRARLSPATPSGSDPSGPSAADALAGYVCYGEIPCTVGSYDLYWIAVDPALQGRGLGRRLIEAAANQVARAGGRALYLDTSGREQYRPTWRFYERSGFTLAARLTDFYAVGDDKLIFVRTLGPPTTVGTASSDL